MAFRQAPSRYSILAQAIKVNHSTQPPRSGQSGTAIWTKRKTHMEKNGGNAFTARHERLQSPRSNGRQSHCECCRHMVTREPGACMLTCCSAGCSLHRCMLEVMQIYS